MEMLILDTQEAEKEVFMRVSWKYVKKNYLELTNLLTEKVHVISFLLIDHCLVLNCLGPLSKP